jgi:hypothetical protein
MISLVIIFLIKTEMDISMIISNKLAASCLLLFSLNIHASIISDIADGLTIKKIFDNALEENASLEDIFSGIGQTNQDLLPGATTYATCNDLGSDPEVTGFAFAALPDSLKGPVSNPEDTVDSLVTNIANAARKCGLSEPDLAQTALLNGVDPTAVGEATAAGGGAPGAGPIGVAGTGSPLGTPGFNGATASNNAASIN